MVNNDLRSLWEQRLADQATIGKSIVTWCREHSIRDNQFYYWRKKLRMDQVEHNHPVKWLPLEVEQTNLAPGSKHKPPKGIIHHSDRGVQYCSREYQATLKKHGV